MCSISFGSTLSFGAWMRRERLLDAQQDDLGVRDRCRRTRCRAGSSRPARACHRRAVGLLHRGGHGVDTQARRSAAWNGRPDGFASRRSTWTPHGAAARRWSASASWASGRRPCPAGSRRLRRAAARGTMAAADPITGGQSMPSTVIAGRAQSMSDTLPSPSSCDAVEHTRRRCGTARADRARPSRSAELSRPVTVVLPRSSRSDASMAISAASASGAAPPNMPECSSDASASTRDDDVDHARAGVTVAAGCPTAALPVSQTRIVSARSRSGLARDELLEPAGALLLRSLDHQLQVHRDVVAERPQREQVGEDVALAVGGAPAVPAAVHLGQLERRRAPGGVVERGLHVVVRVQQHGRGVRVGARVATRPPRRCRPASRSRRASAKPELGELVEHPLRGLRALLRRELARRRPPT